jgi:hypothetical protein
MTVTLSSLPRNLVKTTLLGVRAPFTILEQLDIRIVPSSALDSLEARAKVAIGGALRDDELVREGRLQQARQSQEQTAERWEAEADEARRRADDELAQRLETADAERDEAKRQAAERRRNIEQDESARRAEARQTANARKRRASDTETARREAVAGRRRQAARARIEEQSAALAKREQAQAAERTADAAGDAIEARKAARRPSKRRS